MATFEAFLDHFDRVPQHQSAWRSSLRFNRDRAHHTGKPDLGKAVLWALLLVMHAGFFVALDLLMQHTPSVLDDREQADDALQLRVIRVRQISAPKAESEPTTTVSRESAQQAVKRVPRPQPLPARAITIETADQSDALQAQVITPPSTTSWTPPAKSRDPFARPPADRNLPGAIVVGAPTLRMRDPLTPERVVAKIGGLFGGGFQDPCPDYQVRLMSNGSEAEREEQMERYERACPGR